MLPRTIFPSFKAVIYTCLYDSFLWSCPSPALDCRFLKALQFLAQGQVHSSLNICCRFYSTATETSQVPKPSMPHFLWFLFFFFNYLFIFGCVGSSFLCEGFLSSCRKWGPLFIAVRGPLTIAASCCGAQAPDAQAQ